MDLSREILRICFHVFTNNVIASLTQNMMRCTYMFIWFKLCLLQMEGLNIL